MTALPHEKYVRILGTVDHLGYLHCAKCRDITSDDVRDRGYVWEDQSAHVDETCDDCNRTLREVEAARRILKNLRMTAATAKQPLWYTICDEAECAPDAPFAHVWTRLVARSSSRTINEVKDAYLARDER